MSLKTRTSAAAAIVLGVLALAGAALAAQPQAPDATTAATKKAAKPLKIGSITYEGGDGSSLAQAVVIRNAKDTMEGIAAEAKWIEKMHPGWKKSVQALLDEKGKKYDRIDYLTPDGKTQTIFFDITDFFGK